MISRHRKYRFAFGIAVVAQAALLATIFYEFCGHAYGGDGMPDCTPWIPRFVRPFLLGYLGYLGQPGMLIVPEFTIGDGWVGEWGWNLAVALTNVIVWTLAIGTFFVESHRLLHAIARASGLGGAGWFLRLRRASPAIGGALVVGGAVSGVVWVQRQLVAEAFEDDVYAVYSEALEPLHINKSSLLPLESFTSAASAVRLVTNASAEWKTFRATPGITTDLLQGFAGANATANDLCECFPRRAPYVSLGDYDTTRTHEVFTVSSVGFDSRRERALVYVSRRFPPNYFLEALVLIERRQGRWRLAQTFMRLKQH